VALLLSFVNQFFVRPSWITTSWTRPGRINTLTLWNAFVTFCFSGECYIMRTLSSSLVPSWTHSRRFSCMNTAPREVYKWEIFTVIQLIVAVFYFSTYCLYCGRFLIFTCIVMVFLVHMSSCLLHRAGITYASKYIVVSLLLSSSLLPFLCSRSNSSSSSSFPYFSTTSLFVSLLLLVTIYTIILNNDVFYILQR